jgi:hypothetical protein
MLSPTVREQDRLLHDGHDLPRSRRIEIADVEAANQLTRPSWGS